MSQSLFIQGAVVVDPARRVEGKYNLRVENGRVAEWTKSQSAPAGTRILDARGLILTPGWIDMHVHLREPGDEHKEDIVSGARAAAAGGFTSIVAMANTTPTNDNAAVTRFVLDRAAHAAVRVYTVGALSKNLAGAALADIGDMAAAGVVAISDDGHNVDNALLMRRALEYARGFALPVLTHCEESCLCAGTVMHEGAVSTRLGLRGRPSASEEIIIRRDTALLRETGGHLHVQHLSSALGVDAVRAARAEQLLVTAEVAPHHLWLTDEALASYDPVFRVNPPLRTAADGAALRAGLRDGTIDVIATDHAPHDITAKHDLPIEHASAGTIGLETALPLCLRLVEEKTLTLSKLIATVTCNPARVLKLPAGSLAVGDAADITLFDPQVSWQIDPHKFFSKSRNCMFAGWKVRGRVAYTIVGGTLVHDHREAAHG